MLKTGLARVWLRDVNSYTCVKDTSGPMIKPFSNLFLVLALLLCATFASAASPDSLRMRWVNGQKVRLHKVLPRETWTGVSEKYKVDMQVLLDANPGVKVLKIGQIINIPLLNDDAQAVNSDPVEKKQDSESSSTPTVNTTPQVAAEGNGVTTTYKVQPRDTWSGLARKFGTDMASLQALNPTVAGLKVGQRIRVPATGSSATLESADSPTAVVSATEKVKPATAGKSAQVHTVRQGETLYAISSRYGVSVTRIKELNQLTANGIKVGQRLIVSDNAAAAEAVPPPALKPEPLTPASTPVGQATVVEPAPVDSSGLAKAYSNPGASRSSTIEKDELTGAEIEKFEERGVVAWFGDGETNKGKFYALHRTAPLGTIIKVTNRMNNNSVYVKVVGILQETGDNENIICKITQAAAQRIGVIDQ
ncbi:MAG: LysM peptidoglycan-binding domain-containing protein, partial [Bacteroidota bacterium]